MITHAYVRYEIDRHLAIVPVTDTRNFKPDDDFSVAFYMVKWTDATGTCAHYRARILQVGGDNGPVPNTCPLSPGLARVSVAAARQAPPSATPAEAVPVQSPEHHRADGSGASMIDIGQGLRVAAEAWRRIQARDKDPMFVKDLLITIWDPAQLQGRSLQGKHCPRYPDRPRKEPLTPWKVSVMQGDYSIY
ncbi:hypothetical protein HPB49_007572 [Dermacentor silvarum]|uniref:Uncharacterized protein n=1 Tax=Dermacentor silvarum TaxID=543639 RepID=A0ACB8C889_DERSI|nr:hypothetical protein HPB49_007572 [Dermacentor silvarum]